MRPVGMFFTGVVTVVVALGTGFGTALLLTKSEPTPKMPPNAFAKRDLPVAPDAEPPPPAVVQAVPQPKLSPIPSQATTPEGIAALDFAPPQIYQPPAQGPEPPRELSSTVGAATQQDVKAPKRAPAKHRDVKASEPDPSALRAKPETHKEAVKSHKEVPTDEKRSADTSTSNSKKARTEKRADTSKQYVERRKEAAPLRKQEDDSEDAVETEPAPRGRDPFALPFGVPKGE